MKNTILILLACVAGLLNAQGFLRKHNTDLERTFSVKPSGIPNQGILLVDHQKNNRSGQGGSTLVQAANGDILCFYGNVSGEVFHGGHGVGGWSEYKRSTDGGKTWSEPIVFEPSMQAWQSEDVCSMLVMTVNKTQNGNLIAVAAIFADEGWNKKDTPVYFVSSDNGYSWSEPKKLDAKVSVDEVSITYNGSFFCSKTDTLYLVCIGGVESMCPGSHTLYATDDNGETFTKRSVLPFKSSFTYGTGRVLDDGTIIVYSYPYQGSRSDDQTGVPAEDTDEYNLPYVTSTDGGKSWSEVKTAYFDKRLRNPQMSEKIGSLYFMHGRSGLYGNDPRNLVLYSSKDGINWDKGVLLKKNSRKDGDSYSANAVIKNSSLNTSKLLIQSTVAYDGRYRVNIRHWWVSVED